MRTVSVEELSVAGFLPFGYYSHMINPQAVKIGAPPVEFFRDMTQLDLGSATKASFSTCRVEHRDNIIHVTECHSSTGEGILPLDNDVLIHVGPATPPGTDIPLDEIRVFRVPRGTMVVLRPGVWHHAPFTVDDDPANVLIVLPERAYASDCKVVTLAEEDWIRVKR